MTFDQFIETAWNDHADHPDEVAERLATALDRVTAAEHVAPFARIAIHVYGEHLGQWQRGVALLQALRGVPAFADGSEGAASVTRGIAALRYCDGDPSAIASLAAADQVVALGLATAAFAARGEFRRAIDAYGQALDLARPGLPDGSPALRALAVGGNNLAAVLEGKKDRNAQETRGMLVAAEASLEYWRRAGTWLEEERAHYRLTRSRLAAGEPEAALRSARDCIDVCARNDAPAFEQFFGYAVLALAQRGAGDAAGFADSRAQALRLYDAVPEDERQWCATELAEINAA